MFTLRQCRLWLVCFILAASAVPLPARAATMESARNGDWSDRDTWAGQRVPGAGDSVHILGGHVVRYDTASSDVIASILINGTLAFAPNLHTRLEVGLIAVTPTPAFDLQMACSGGMTHGASDPAPALEVGTPDRPVQPGVSAVIRLHAVPGLDPNCAPAIVTHGGRLDIHGAPLARTWVKLAATAAAGTSVVELADAVDWKVGDQVLLTGTFFPPGAIPGATILNGQLQPESEPALITGVSADGLTLTLDRTLVFTHGGTRVGAGMVFGEVANLSRNVVIESADPAGIRGHTMYHIESMGSISYAEFRHLGKQGTLGRYPIHFHLVKDSMRGSSVVGASVWDSANRWVVIHGTEFITVRDTVGVGSIGHGFFLEDGSEVYNFFEGNLGVQAYVAAPIPNQFLAYDQNRGACFWTANARNFVIGNTFTECDNDPSFILDYPPGNQPMPISVLQPDGTRALVDVRSLSGGLIQDLEIHSTWGWGPWIRGSTYPPDEPLVFRNTRLWNMHYSAEISGDNVVFDGVEMVNAPYGFYNRYPGPHLVRNAYFERVSPHGAFMTILGGHGVFLYEDVVLKSSELAIRMDAMAETGANGRPIQIHARNASVLDPVFISPGGVVRTAWAGTEDDAARADPLLMLVLHDLFGPNRDGLFLPTAQSTDQDGVPPGLTFMDATGVQDGSGVLLEGRGSVQYAEADVAWPDSPLAHPVDRLPPATMILSPGRGSRIPTSDGTLRVCGVAMDQFGIAAVSVNGVAATLDPDGFDWCATLTALSDGPLAITATATDRSGLVELTPHTIEVNVCLAQECPAPCPQPCTVNSIPVADAGPDQTVSVGATAQLDGEGSSDADGDPLSFSWLVTAAPAGSVTTLSNPAAPTPTLAIDRPGTYTIQLTVADGVATSSPDAVVITARDSIQLSATGTIQKGKIVVNLSWQGGTSFATVNVRRAVDGSGFVTIATGEPNDGSYRDATKLTRSHSISYVVCDITNAICSNTVLLAF